MLPRNAVQHKGITHHQSTLHLYISLLLVTCFSVVKSYHQAIKNTLRKII